MLRRLRSRPGVNRVIRRAIAGFAGGTARAAQFLTSRWRVAGEVEIEVAGHRLRMLADADDNILNRLYYRQEWEPGELEAWVHLVPHARTVLDIGANTGVYALLAAAVQPGAAVHAFEPHPTNCARLRQNLALGAATRVSAHELAVGDAQGTVEFTIPASGQISDVASVVRSFTEAHYGIPYRQHRVRQTTVDAFVAEHGLGRVELIKIDVEYYELAVLRGAVDTLARQAPVLLCEVFDHEVLAHRFPGAAAALDPRQRAEVEALLRAHGYHFYAIGKQGLLRVADLHSNPDGGANFVFSTVETPERWLPWSNGAAFARLMAAPRRG